MADVSKFTAYAVVGPPDNHEVVSKLTAYAVTGPPENHAIVSKYAAYAVVGPVEAAPSTGGRRVQNVNYL